MTMTKTKITNNMPKGVSAYYDPSTDTVYTPELYSYSWYHEMVHARQQQNVIVNFMTNSYPSLAYHVGFLGFVLAMIINYDPISFFLWIGIVYFPLVFVFGLCEVDAYVRGWIYYKKKKHFEVELI